VKKYLQFLSQRRETVGTRAEEAVQSDLHRGNAVSEAASTVQDEAETPRITQEREIRVQNRSKQLDEAKEGMDDEEGMQPQREVQEEKASQGQQRTTASALLHHVGRTTSFTTERERNNYFYREDSPQVGETQSNITMSSGMTRFNPDNNNQHNVDKGSEGLNNPVQAHGKDYCLNDNDHRVGQERHFHHLSKLRSKASKEQQNIAVPSLLQRISQPTIPCGNRPTL
jgi:hypothetical protein